MELLQNYASWEPKLPLLYIKPEGLPPTMDKKAATIAITADLIPAEWIDEVKALREQELYLIKQRKALVGKFQGILNSTYPDLLPVDYLKQHHPEVFI